VSRIMPLVTRYADVRLDDQQKTNRVERWRRISLEAVKQCGRRRLVEITSPCTLREFIAANEASPDASPGAASHIERAKLLFSERGGIAVTDALAGISKPCPIVALVGPEGGWSDDELDILNAFGCQAISFGPRVLRTEAAR